MKILRLTCCCFVLFLSLVVFAQVPWSQASAASARVTQGNVEALLHARIGAGGIYFPSHIVGYEKFQGVIFPLSGFNGEYCVDDWHVVLIADVDVIDNVFFFTKEQAIADLKATTITYTLDGVPLPVTQTPIIKLNTADEQRFGFAGQVFAFQAGSILSPAALSVGTHTAGIVATAPSFGTFTDSSTFTVDPSGTGVCLQG